MDAESMKVWVGLVVGIIGLLGIVTGVLLRDLVIRSAFDWFDRRRSSKSVYRRYAEPLSLAVTSLFWRLREVFEDPGRAGFLQASHPMSTFDHYKLLSTQYRLAATLGWIWAMRRELSVLRGARGERVARIESALDDFEHSLASGSDLEIERVEGIFRLWSLGDFRGRQDHNYIAAKVDHEVRAFFNERKLGRSSEIAMPDKIGLVDRIYHSILSCDSSLVVDKCVIRDQAGPVVALVLLRGAWLFRDWQAAVAEVVVRETASTRRFDVIGFGEFEALCFAPSEQQFRALSRVSNLFDGIQSPELSVGDHRPVALKAMYVAIARLVWEFSRAPGGGDLISGKTVVAALGAINKFRPDLIPPSSLRGVLWWRMVALVFAAMFIELLMYLAVDNIYKAIADLI